MLECWIQQTTALLRSIDYGINQNTMYTENETIDQELNLPVKKKVKHNLPLRPNTMVKIEFVELLRDEPDVDSAFLILLESGAEEWMPYSKCHYKGTTLFMPLWLYRRRVAEGRI